MIDTEFMAWVTKWLTGQGWKYSDGEKAILKEASVRPQVDAVRLDRAMSRIVAMREETKRPTVKSLLEMIRRTAEPITPQREGLSAPGLGYTAEFHAFLQDVAVREQILREEFDRQYPLNRKSDKPVDAGSYQVTVRFLSPEPDAGPLFAVLGSACDRTGKYFLALQDLSDGKKIYVAPKRVAELEFVEQLEGATA